MGQHLEPQPALRRYDVQQLMVLHAPASNAPVLIRPSPGGRWIAKRRLHADRGPLLWATVCPSPSAQRCREWAARRATPRNIGRGDQAATCSVRVQYMVFSCALLGVYWVSTGCLLHVHTLYRVLRTSYLIRAASYIVRATSNHPTPQPPWLC
jgi:hypothetical protein